MESGSEPEEVGFMFGDVVLLLGDRSKAGELGLLLNAVEEYSYQEVQVMRPLLRSWLSCHAGLRSSYCGGYCGAR